MWEETFFPTVTHLRFTSYKLLAHRCTHESIAPSATRIIYCFKFRNRLNLKSPKHHRGLYQRYATICLSSNISACFLGAMIVWLLFLRQVLPPDLCHKTIRQSCCNYLRQLLCKCQSRLLIFSCGVFMIIIALSLN